MSFCFKNLTELPEELQLRVRAWRNDPSVRAVMLTSRIISESEHLKWLAGLKAGRDRLALIGFDGGRPVGFYQFCAFDRPRGTADSGFYVNPEKSLDNKGYYAYLLNYYGLSHGFQALRLRGITGSVLDFNTQVLKMLAIFGFKETGRRDSGAGTLIDFILTRDGWQERRGRIERVLRL